MKSLGFMLYEHKVREFCEIGPCPTVSAIRKRWDMMTLEARGHYESLAGKFLEAVFNMAEQDLVDHSKGEN